MCLFIRSLFVVGVHGDNGITDFFEEACHEKTSRIGPGTGLKNIDKNMFTRRVSRHYRVFGGLDHPGTT